MYRDVERITVLVREPGQPQPSPRVIHRAKKDRRRNRSAGTGWFEGLTRNTIRATTAGMNSYLDRHERSNRRSPDGWLCDMPENLWAAYLQGKQNFGTWRDW
jgi:hypothetical protein